MDRWIRITWLLWWTARWRRRSWLGNYWIFKWNIFRNIQEWWYHWNCFRSTFCGFYPLCCWSLGFYFFSRSMYERIFYPRMFLHVYINFCWCLVFDLICSMLDKKLPWILEKFTTYWNTTFAPTCCWEEANY